MNLNYSNVAKALIEKLDKFDLEKFEKWHIENNKYIIYQNFMDFIMTQKQLGVLEFAKQLSGISVDREFILNPDVKYMLEKTKIDENLLKKFFIKISSNIGDGNIMQYLMRNTISDNEKKQKKLNESLTFIVDNLDKLKKLINNT
jgi:hypothetical protein